MTAKAKHPPLPEAFKKLDVDLDVLRGLADAGFEEPSEIQSLMIGPALDGHDILGQARTGTGKTAAFGIPILCEAVHGYATQAIILAPTRELAVQIEAELTMLAKHTKIRVACVYGGDRIAKQMRELKHSPEIIVGTPGRVMDLIERRVLDFCNMRFVVLDEVDRMLDIGFRDDIRKILKSINDGLDIRNRVKEVYGVKIHQDYADAGDEEGVPELPDDELQTMFVSATISKEIEKLARSFMRNDDVKKLVATGADESPTVELVEQYHVPVSGYDKGDLILALLKQEEPELAIVFTRTKRGAEKLTKKLTAAGIDVREIHGNLNQSKREKVMKGFRDKKFDVLVATDLASRGIDVRGVSHIINYDVPGDAEAYVHRIGRTARMGNEGKAYTFVTPDQGQELTRIEMLINMEIPRGEIEGFAGQSRDVQRASEEEVLAADAERNGQLEADPEPAKPEPLRRRRRGVGKSPLRGRR
ncbi:MAG: DEAD/DEAH box helicase [Planctomycetota bacterium]